MSKKYPQVIFENGIWKGPSKNFENDGWQIGARLLTTLRESPTFIGQIDSKTGYEDTFEMMMDRSIRCALWLKKRGIGVGDVISVSTHNQLDAIIPVLASFYIGSALNTFWTNSLDVGLINHFMNTVEPRVIFADEQSADLLDKCTNISSDKVEVIVFGRHSKLKSFDEILQESSINESQSFQCADVSLEQTALLVFTSGTSGNPKAFKMPYRQMIRDLNWLPGNLLRESRGTWCTNIGWITGIISMLSAVLNRSTHVIYNYVNAIELSRFIENFKIQWMMLGVQHVNMLSQITNARDFDFSTVELIRYCGAYIRPQVEKRLHEMFPEAWISQSYGITEFGVITCAMKDHECPSCGIPAENVEIKLMTKDNEVVTKPRELGEVHVRVPQLSVTYKNLETSKTSLDSDGWYHTGDVAYYNETGEFFMVDRIKELIRFRTDDVPPGTVEDCILKHPGVVEVAVVPKLHDDDVEQPLAFIVRKPRAEVTKTEIERLVEEQLPDRMRLRGGIIFLDKMPYNSSNKIDKSQLRCLANNLKNFSNNGSI